MRSIADRLTLVVYLCSLIVAAAPTAVRAEVTSCAAVSVTPSLSSLSGDVLTVTVVDASPYGPSGLNDCNGDGDRTDPEDNDDCNANAIVDVDARVFSEGEPAGELVVLDRVGTSSTYRGTIAVSTKFNATNALFVRQNGTNAPVVRAQYQDRDDGGGGACGPLESTASFSVPVGSIVLKSWTLSDNGDNDGIPDTSETVTMGITAINKTGISLTGVTARLFSSSATVACISDNKASIGSMGVDATVASADTFTFRIGAVNRTAVAEDLSASFLVTFEANEIKLTRDPQEIGIDLDLNMTGGGVVTGYAESFESTIRTNFLSFTSTGGNLDANKATNALSDGLRCSYTDPDAPNSNTPGDPSCFVGFTNAADNAYDWHVHFPTDPDGGRAYVGTRSLHFGVHGLSSNEDTTRLSQLDSVRMNNPMSLGWNGVTSELSFKHQVSFADSRVFAIPSGETVDRGVVQLQLADSVTGQAFGPWSTIRPYYNSYDSQGTAVDLDRCMFDPPDDGTNEDSYFPTTDQRRFWAASSTCYADGHVFAFQGDTSTGVFDPTHLGRASDGPGLAGSLGGGTWVESRFNLQRYRGRRVRIRFLATTGEHNGAITHATDSPPVQSGSVADDGWYIDDVRVANTLSSPATVTADMGNPSLPACPGSACNVVTASLSATPSTLPAAGGTVTLSAELSTADLCVDGTIQYQFWREADGNGVPGTAGDVLIRDFTDNPVVSATVNVDTQFGVRVRCSSATDCSASAVTSVDVVTCADGSIVRLQGPAGTQNVGQAVRFGVSGVSPTAFQWSVAGPIVADYYESIRNRWTTYPMTPGRFQQNTIWFYWKPVASQIHPLNGGPVTRAVSVDATLQDGTVCSYSVDVAVERNGIDPAKQAVDFFTAGHGSSSCESCGDASPACGPSVWDYSSWWWSSRRTFDGALFFDVAHQMLDRYAKWRTEFGYGPIGTWDPGTPIHNDPDVNYTCRWTTYYRTAKPQYFGVCQNSGRVRGYSGAACDTSHGGEDGLADFPSNQRLLGCAVSFPFVNVAQNNVGYTMGGPYAPKDGLFFRLRAFIDQISIARSACTPPRVNYQVPFRAFPFVTDYPAVTEVDFDQPVSGVAPEDLMVNGSPATEVTGEGAGPYVFSGYSLPGLGPVAVEVLPGNIVDEESESFLGATWSVTLVDPVGDTDGDGLSNTDEIELHFTDPTSADSDGDGDSDGNEVQSGSNPLDQQSPCVGPGFDGVLSMSKSGDTIVSWTPGSATTFDVVRGDLSALRGDCDHDGDATDCVAGSFTPALAACLANDSTDLSVADLAADPAPGNGWFYLMRAVAACGSGGTYDDAGVAVPRDGSIQAAEVHCP